MNDIKPEIKTRSQGSVKLKGAGKGFRLTLDPSRPENPMKEEVSSLFENLKHLARNAEVVIDTEGIKGYDHVLDNIKSFLIDRFKVKKVCVYTPAAEKKDKIDSKNPWMFHRSDVLMLKGRIRSGQKIESKKHIVIAGDVNPGAEIAAGGDVIILGRLKGKVHAGVPDKTGAIIFALEFNPTQIRISDVTAVGSDETAVTRAEYACIENNKIIVRDYLKANPFALIPWPQAL